jgi:hypothetical protein
MDNALFHKVFGVGATSELSPKVVFNGWTLINRIHNRFFHSKLIISPADVSIINVKRTMTPR